MTADGLAAKIAHRWVQVYTRGLPVEAAEQRREEILSDLWEHHDDSVRAGRSRRRHDLEVIERVLCGIPADLSWRRGIQRSQPRPATGDPMSSILALIIVAGLGVAAPLPFLVLLGTGLEMAELLWVLGSLALAAVLATGLSLRLRASRPTLATALLTIGAFAPSMAWFWLPPAYLLTLAVIVAAVVTARNRPAIEPHAA